MTRTDAIAKAQAKAARTGQPHLVTSRTEHPAHPGHTVYLTVAMSDKRTWAPDERFVFHTDHPDDITAAWYALDCAPPTGSKPHMTVDEMREVARRCLN